MKGFTLLEVMIALAIMAGSVFTIMASFNHHIDIVTRDREETVAVLLARAKLEDPDMKSSSDTNGTFAPEWPDITWEITKTPTELSSLDRMVLTVSWDNARRSLSLVQYVTK